MLAGESTNSPPQQPGPLPLLSQGSPQHGAGVVRNSPALRPAARSPHFVV